MIIRFILCFFFLLAFAYEQVAAEHASPVRSTKELRSSPRSSNNASKKAFRKQVVSVDFSLEDLNPACRCSDDTIRLQDITVYPKGWEVVYDSKQTYWIIETLGGATDRAPYGPGGTLSYRPKVPNESARFRIGLHVGLRRASDGDTGYAEDTSIVTKQVYQKPRIHFLSYNSSTKDRCINNDPYILDFAEPISSVELDTSYVGTGVEQHRDGSRLQYIFSPKEAGEGTHEITFNAVPTNPFNPCTASLTKKIKVIPLPVIKIPYDTININTTDRSYTIRDLGISVTPNSNRKVTYLWSPNIGLSDPTIPNPIVEVSNSIVYRLLVTTTDPKDPECFACSTEKYITFNFAPCLDAVSPLSNFITPNGDGINDFLYFKNLDKYDSASVSIYTRAGQLVWSSLGYQEPWDGKYKDGRVLAETYYYIIEVRLNAVVNTTNRCPNTYTGFVQVIL